MMLHDALSAMARAARVALCVLALPLGASGHAQLVRQPPPLIVIPDAAHLSSLADSAGINPAIMEAIAWVESGVNLSPSLRGHYCWWSRHVDSATTIVHHERDCEVGRFQIKPSTARLRCAGLNIWTYDGNTHCFVKMFSEDMATMGLTAAIKHHNGTGHKADEYVEKVYATVGRLLTQGET